MSVDVYESIRNGSYETKLPFPTRPSPPSGINKKLSEFKTEKEIQTALREKDKYEQALKDYESQREAYYKEEGRLFNQFYQDICAEEGVPHSHPFIEQVYTRAWREGHSLGLNDVYSTFMDLLKLWTIAIAHGMKKEIPS